MLNPKELRIGNWFRYLDHEMVKPTRRAGVFQVIPDDIVFLSENENFEYVEPITITPEILTEWCGFIENHQPTFSGGYDYFMKFFEQADTKGTYSTRKFTISDKTGYVFLNDHFIGRCDYLHQLQNLVHTLFEIELEIKIPQS